MTNSDIQFFFDFSSPYGYLAAQKIDALAAKHGRSVDWRAMLWAKQKVPGAAARVAKALYRAFFVDGLDISKPDIAAAVAGQAGLDRDTARAAIDDPAIKEALRREVDAAIAAGVFGSPFVIVDGEPFWGLDRFEQIDRWLANGGF